MNCTPYCADVSQPLKSLCSNHVHFKEHIKIVKMCMVQFSATVSDKSRIMGFYKKKVNTSK